MKNDILFKRYNVHQFHDILFFFLFFLYIKSRYIKEIEYPKHVSKLKDSTILLYIHVNGMNKF